MSYGTGLGATIAAMFPDRIGKMILDGVLNPHEYWHSLYEHPLSPSRASCCSSAASTAPSKLT